MIKNTKNIYNLKFIHNNKLMVNILIILWDY